MAAQSQQGLKFSTRHRNHASLQKIVTFEIGICALRRPAAGQAVTWCALSLCIANSLNQQYGAAAPGDEKPGPFFGDPML